MQPPTQATIDVRSSEGHGHLNDQGPHFLVNTLINDQDNFDFKLCFTSTHSSEIAQTISNISFQIVNCSVIFYQLINFFHTSFIFFCSLESCGGPSSPERYSKISVQDVVQPV